MAEKAVEVPRALIEQIQTGNCVLFVGAGISLGTHGQRGLPGGVQLARELARRADFCTLGRCWNLDEDRRSCRWDSGCVVSLPTVAQHCVQEWGRRSLVAYVCDRLDAPALKPLQAHRLIAALPFSIIVTTNFDRLLEEALRDAGKQVTLVVGDAGIPYADVTKTLLVKMHGSVEQPASLVLTEEDYVRFFARLPALSTMLSGFFATRTLLFVGYSLADPNFRRLYLEVVGWLGEHKRRAYGDGWQPSPFEVRFWARQGLELIDADATTFLLALSHALGKEAGGGGRAGAGRRGLAGRRAAGLPGGGTGAAAAEPAPLAAATGQNGDGHPALGAEPDRRRRDRPAPAGGRTAGAGWMR